MLFRSMANSGDAHLSLWSEAGVIKLQFNFSASCDSLPPKCGQDRQPVGLAVKKKKRRRSRRKKSLAPALFPDDIQQPHSQGCSSQSDKIAVETLTRDLDGDGLRDLGVPGTQETESPSPDCSDGEPALLPEPSPPSIALTLLWKSETREVTMCELSTFEDVKKKAIALFGRDTGCTPVLMSPCNGKIYNCDWLTLRSMRFGPSYSFRVDFCT